MSSPNPENLLFNLYFLVQIENYILYLTIIGIALSFTVKLMLISPKTT